MADATATLGRTFSPDAAPSAALAGSENSKNFSSHVDPNLLRKPEYFVYLYSVSGREFTVELPPHIRRLIIRACPAGQPWTLVTKLAHPFQQPDNDDNGNLIARSHDARRVAMDICNPSNTSLDQDLRLDPKFVLAYGNNLTQQGVFWSLNYPPTEEEVKKAVARKETYYRGLLEKARTLELANPKELEFELNMDYHMAADYFGVETNWHKRVERPAFCPNCGEGIKTGVAFHKHPDGFLCVIDWKRTVEAGVKSKDDVPDHLRWWEPEDVAEPEKPKAKEATGAKK